MSDNHSQENADFRIVARVLNGVTVASWAATLCLIGLTVAMILNGPARPTVNHVTKPEPSFKYGDKVVVVKGFHAGRAGTVVDDHKNHDGTWDLLVNFDGDFDHVSEDFLQQSPADK